MTTATAGTGKRARLIFSDGDRAAHERAFMAWLPEELRDLAGVDWREVPSRSMGYLVNTVGRGNPDRGHLAVAAAALARGCRSESVQYHILSRLTCLLRLLRDACELADIPALGDPSKRVWIALIERTDATANRLAMLGHYATVTGTYLPLFLDEVHDPDARAVLDRYVLPALPPAFVHRYGGRAGVEASALEARKAHSDVVVPLHTVLIALLLRRKAAAERLLAAVCEARQRACAGALPLPYAFVVEDVVPEVEDRTVARIKDAHIGLRPVRMRLTLWDKPSWVLHHPERYSKDIIGAARARRDAYVPARDKVFVAYDGPAHDLLWFGDIIADGLLQDLGADGRKTDEARTRLQRSRDLGASRGFCTWRGGLLASGDQWFSTHWRPGDCIFEPASLYRGVLYGTALALAAMTGSPRTNELLQFSLDRRGQRRVSYVKETKDGRMVRIHDTLYYQRLLPKGYSSDHERKFFPIWKPVVALLGEIERGLRDAHGDVPVVRPHLNHTKGESLAAERYYFQWGASLEGKAGALSPVDVNVLVRFMFHGLDLRTRDGDPIDPTVHVIRHATATAARDRGGDDALVDLAISNLMLHHKQVSPLRAGGGYEMPPASRMYTLPPLDRQMETIDDWFNTVEEDVRGVVDVSVPTATDLGHLTARMRERLQATYDKFGFLLPVTFGRCGNENACPRGLKNALCIGCAWLQVDPSKEPEARVWQRVFAMQAELLERQGNQREARAMRLQLLELEDIINGMVQLHGAVTDGGYAALFQGFARLPDGRAVKDV